MCWFATDCHPKQGDGMVGRMRRKKGKTNDDWERANEVSSREYHGDREEDREKWGRREEGWACCQLKILILTHTRTHILDSLLALACRYDATVIHDS